MMDEKDFLNIERLQVEELRNELANLKLKINKQAEVIETGKILSSEIDLDSLLKLVMSEVTRVMEADRSTLYLINNEKNELWTKIAQGPDMVPFSISMDRGIAGYVARTGQVVNITDARSDPRHYRYIDQQTGYITKSMLCVPMNNMRGERTGVIQVLNKLNGVFTSEDEQLLSGLASQAAIALENAQLYDSLKNANVEIQDTYVSTLDALVAALDIRDIETSNHSRRVVEYSMMITKAMGIEGRELDNIRWGAMLHDVGKIGVPDAILRKPSSLTAEEEKEIKKHPEIGYNMLAKIDFLQEAMPVVLHHHEKYNGTGYPSRLSGEQIPLGARIFAVADSFDAMTSGRPYRKAVSYEEARDEIKRCSGTQFDPKVAEAFLKVPKERWETVRTANL